MNPGRKLSQWQDPAQYVQNRGGLFSPATLQGWSSPAQSREVKSRNGWALARELPGWPDAVAILKRHPAVVGHRPLLRKKTNAKPVSRQALNKKHTYYMLLWKKNRNVVQRNYNRSQRTRTTKPTHPTTPYRTLP